MGTAIVRWARADWRRRRGALIGLVLLAGLSGAVVLTAAAGAQRTATSLDRLAVDTRAADAMFDVGTLDPGTARAIAELPVVTDAASVAVVFAVVDGVEDDLALFIPRDDRLGVTVERDRVLRGRMPDPARADEVAINEIAARLTGVGVGDRLTIATMSPEQVQAEDYFPPRGPRVDVVVVGLTRGAGDLVEGAEGSFLASPAVWPLVDGRADVFTTFLGVHVAEGVSEAELRRAVRALVPADQEIGELSFDIRTKPARDTIAALAAGIAVFGVVAGVASIAVISQAVVRHLALIAADGHVLTALGMSRAAERAALIVSVMPVALGSAALAVVGAVAASPLMPVGLAGRAEPDPGVSVDAPVLALGAGGMVALVALTAAAMAWWSTAGASRARHPARTSMAASMARQAGAGPVVVNGVRLALDRRAPALPVVSTIGGVAAGIIGVVAALTFNASLDRLIASPVRWGYDWDLELSFTSADVAERAQELLDDPGLAAVARWDSGFSYLGGRGLRAYGLTVLRGDIGFSLVAGRQPETDDEIVIGPDTADRLGLAVGDVVEVASGPTMTAETVRVVGTGLFPEIDEGNFGDAVGFHGRAFEDHAVVPNLFEASQVVVRFAAGTQPSAVVGELASRYPDVRVTAPENRPRPPGPVANLLEVRAVPRWLAVFVGALALGSLTHILFTTLKRRQGEFATLRSLGLTAGQASSCMVWQALTIGVVGLAAGLPLGLLAGRNAWRSVAAPVGVAVDVLLPWSGVGAVGIGALALASLTAAVIAHRPSQQPIADALRAE